MLLTWIAEVADEPLVLEPDDPRAEAEVNTWSLSAGAEDRRSLSVPEVVSAFEQTAAAIRERIRELGSPETATFYVWHDEQTGQLRCSTSSLPVEALPFSAVYAASDDLAPVIEEFLTDSEPGVVTWPELDDVRNHSEQPGAAPETTPLHVWVSSVGTSP
ncbi:hypothetical protein CW362_24215 [Streptomyces populi]|uniref:Uncharacterized protein n=1 Tax=Streptomyces populi TaxID=2058924 RepID=A0A2I0SKJ3_9ACTN|nr:hypothetical protein [Streptomyces populi]PKT70465.1 hypothetical protein CW362_24215 [Streptomyces populi]